MVKPTVPDIIGIILSALNLLCGVGFIVLYSFWLNGAQRATIILLNDYYGDYTEILETVIMVIDIVMLVLLVGGIYVVVACMYSILAFLMRPKGFLIFGFIVMGLLFLASAALAGAGEAGRQFVVQYCNEFDEQVEEALQEIDQHCYRCDEEMTIEECKEAAAEAGFPCYYYVSWVEDICAGTEELFLVQFALGVVSFALTIAMIVFACMGVCKERGGSGGGGKAFKDSEF